MSGEDTPPVTHYRLGEDDAGFYAEFLTAKKGSGLRRDGQPDPTVSKAGITAQKLRHLDLLLEAPWLVRIGAETMPITRPVDLLVPNPVSFVVQKLLIHKRRDARKKAQDILYIHDTLELFGASLGQLRTVWKDEVRPRIPARTASRAMSIAGDLFNGVTDVIRDAARIPQDRRLQPEGVRATIQHGLEEVFVPVDKTSSIEKRMSKEVIPPVSNHSLAFVPLGAGYHQSTDIFARGRPIDTGLLAESLIYYDRVLMHVDSPVQFSQLISLLIQQGLSVADIIALFRADVIGIYNFAFTTNPFIDFISPDSIQIHGLYNFQDQTMQQPNSFLKRFLEFEPLREVFENNAQYERFVAALEGRVIEVKADEIGSSAIDNAYGDFLNPERSALMAQELVNEIYRIKGFGKPPKLSVEIKELGDGQFMVGWNIPLNRLPALETETNIKAAVTLPLSTAAEGNKYLWVSDRLKCDLYLARPISTLVGDKLFEAGEAALRSKIRTKNVIEELEVRVEFPDLRRYVNLDKIDFPRVLEIRKKAKKFREWLQSEAERDRDAIIAYHREVAAESGFGNVTRKSIKLFGVLGGAAVGAGVGAALGHAVGGAAGAVLGAGAGKGVAYLSELASNVGANWKPVVFGDWYSARIAKLLKEDS